MVVAADWFATISIVRQQFCLIANPDLFHLDSRLELRSQQFYKITKIDTLLGQVENHDPFAAEQLLDIDQLHLQTERINVLLASINFIPPSPIEVIDRIKIIIRYATHDVTSGRIIEMGKGIIGGFTKHLADFQSAIRANDDFVTTPILRVVPRSHHSQTSHGSVSNDIFWH